MKVLPNSLISIRSHITFYVDLKSVYSIQNFLKSSCWFVCVVNSLTKHVQPHHHHQWLQQSLLQRTKHAAALISTSLIYYTTVAVIQLRVYFFLDGIRRVGDVLLYLGGG